MNTKISDTIKEQLRKTASVKGIPGQGVQQQKTIDRAVDSVVAEFTGVANDSVGRQRLYNAVNLADKVSSPQEAGVQLRNIVGDKGQKRLVAQFRAGSSLTELQVENVLAIVSPSVLSALGSELTEGSVQNSAAGLATLLNSQGDVSQASTASVGSTKQAQGKKDQGKQDQNKPARKHAGTQPVYSSGGTAVAASENSGFTRFALPLLLLGALILGSVKYCSDSEKSRVVAEERSNLQLELAGAQEESELQTTKFASLQGEYDSAQSQIGQLQSEYDSAQSQIAQLQDDLQSSKTELEALRDVPTETAELQLSLANLTSERDAAIDSGSELQEQLEQTGTERDQAMQQAESLTAELDVARLTISDNEESIANIDMIKAEIVEITAARDDALERNIELTAANEKLQQQVDGITPTITDLESQVESLTSARTELDQQLLDTSQALDSEKSDRKADVDQLTVEIEELKNQVAETAPTVEKLEGQVGTLTDEKTQLETQLGDTTEALEQARADRQQDTERLTAETTDLSGQLTQMLGFRNAAEASLEKRDAKVAELTGTVTVLEEQVASLEKANEEANQSAMLLQKRIDELDGELKSVQEDIDERDSQLAASTETLESTNSKLEVALGDFDSLEKERNALVGTQEELTQKIEALNVEKNAAMDEIESRDAKISELTSDLQTAMSDVEANETRIAELESSLEMERTTVSELENSNGSLEQEKTTLQADYGTANGKIDALDEQLLQQGRRLLRERQTVVTLSDAAARREADAQALTDETRSIRETIEQQLIQAGIKDARVQSIDDDRAVAITLGSGNLFQTGEASLTRGGGIVLAKIGNILTNYSDWRIDVEGHTDSFAIGKSLRKQYPTNWELSSARASSAVRHLKNVGGVDAESLSVHGFAETRPIADNSNARGREQNRRVDIILRR